VENVNLIRERKHKGSIAYLSIPETGILASS